MNFSERATVRFLAALFLAVEFGVASAVAFPAKVHADDGRVAFVAKARADDFTGSDQSLYANGKWVCDRLFASNWNEDQVAAKLRENNALNAQQALTFVDDAVAILCPQYADRSHAPAGDEVHQGGVV